jgi:hypothetical protein
MRRFRFPSGLPALLTLVVLSTCDGIDTPSDGVDDSQLTVVRVAPNAPPLEADSVTFWAVRGADRQAEMNYVYPDGSRGKCLLFRVPADALQRRPDGRAFLPGDSVRITIHVVDRTRFQFRFEPAGLRFDPQNPAELEVRYRWADPDFNGDGVVDARDATAASALHFWYQETFGGRWTQLPTTVLLDAIEAHTIATRFSQYALAID